MKYLRPLLAPILLATLMSGAALAQAPAPATFELLLREAIEAAPGQELSVNKLTVAPGYVATSHSHPGETFVFILEGRILNQVGDEEPKVYEPGQFFFEHANAVHARFENLDPEKPAVVLIYGIRPAGSN